MKVKDIMSKEIASLRSEDSIEKAAQLMKGADVGSIPVCDGEQIIGIVTDRDIALRAVANGQSGKGLTVGSIMTSNTIVGNPEMNVHDAVKIMSQHQIRRLPIVENNSLVGMVALGDISLENDLQNDAAQGLASISQPDNNEI